MTDPYYADEHVTLYLGRHEDVLPTLGLTFDLIVADPPYGETSLDWDRWPQGWPSLMTAYARSMWCFGSMRMFLDRRDEFAGWKLSQDVVWEKHNGSGFHADRFRRVHEHATHWYAGPWATIHHEPPTTATASAKRVHRKQRPAHTGHIDGGHYADRDCDPDQCAAWGEFELTKRQRPTSEDIRNRRTGIVHLLLSAPRPCEPIDCRGALGLWRVPDDVARLLEAVGAR